MSDDDLAWREMFRECPPCLLGDHAHCDGWLFWCVCRSAHCLRPLEDRA